MRIGDEDAGDEILFPRRHAGAALAAAALRPIGGQRHALDVALVAHSDDHVLALDQVLVLDLGVHLEDLGAARGAELRLDGVELVLDDGDDAGARAQDGEIVGDLAAELRQLIADLVAAERGQALEPEVEDGAGLILGQAIRPFRRDLVARVGDKLDQGDHVLCRPILGHQSLARRSWVGRLADQRNDLVDIGDGDGEADEDMGAIARLAQQELGTAADHLLAEIGEGADHVLEVELLGPASDQRHDVGAEGRLQRREAVELVQHHVGHGVALQLDDHAHAVAARLVANIGDAFDLLLAHQLGDPLHHGRLVHLIGNLGDDQRLALLAQDFGGDAAAHQDRAAALVIGGADACPAEDQAAGGEVRAWNDLDQLLDRDRRIVEIGDAGVDHLAEIVRRDVGGHADGDAAGAVDQQVRELRRQDHRFLLAPIVVRLEVDRLILEIVEQRHGRTCEPHLGIALGRGRIAVDRAEIALPVDQRHAHGEVLRHAHQSVVDRLVAVRVILTHGVAGDARRFVVGAIRRVVVLVHRIEDAAMHGFQPVAHVGQRTGHDHAHGVIEIRPLHLVDDRDRPNVRRASCARSGRLIVVGQGRWCSVEELAKGSVVAACACARPSEQSVSRTEKACFYN